MGHLSYSKIGCFMWKYHVLVKIRDSFLCVTNHCIKGTSKLILPSVSTQQTFVLMKTSWRHLGDIFRLRFQKTSSKRFQEVLIKTNIIVLVIRLQDVFKLFSTRLAKTSSKRFQDVFKMSYKNVFKTSSKLIQDVLKTSLRCPQDVLQRSLQDVFKMYHQVKLFLLTRFQNDFETYSKRFWDVLQRRLSTEGFA